MRFASINKDDKNLQDLTKRLFRLQGKGSQAATRQAAETLLAANPELGDFKTLPVGSRIKVPDSAPPIQPGEEATPPLELNPPELQRLTAMLDSMQTNMTEIEDRMLSRLQSSLELVKSIQVPREFTALISQSPIKGIDEMPDPESMTKAANDAISLVKAAKSNREQNMSAFRVMLGSPSRG
jgi:hypothetical protein